MSARGSVDTVPVTIITGFLGSGKTTLLNQLLKSPLFSDTVVIVNEFGAVGIDHLLIEQAVEDAVLLKNGCICCTVSGDVADTLDSLWRRREAGALPPFRRIAIETTGLADPAPVVNALRAGEGQRYACRLDGIVTTVDAVHSRGQLRDRDEARRQVAMADRVLLTKTDLADAAMIAQAVAEVCALNSTATIHHVISGDINPSIVFEVGPNTDADVSRFEHWLLPHAGDQHRGHNHVAFRHGQDISSVVLRRTRPVSWSKLGLWLNSLLSLRGDRILRLKGLVRLESHERPLVLQGVHHVLHPPVFLERAAQGSLRTQLVLISRGLSAEGLRASFSVALS